MQPHTKTYEQLLAELERTQQELARAVNAQQRAEAERDDLRAMFNQAPVLICTNQGPDHLYTLANDLYRSVFGGRELIGKTLLEAVPEFEGQVHLDHIAQVYRTGQPHVSNEVKATIRKRNGLLEEGYYTYILQPIRDARGQVKDILTVGTEVTEQVAARRRLEEMAEALKRVDKLKDQFLGILSHELRTPINAIMGFGSILEDELKGPLNPEQHRYLAKMLNSSDKLLALVNDLLDASRIQAGKFTLEPRLIELLPIVNEVLASQAVAARQKQIELGLAQPTELPPLHADDQRVAQVVSNLVGNAIKFTQAGGWVELRARVEGAFVCVEVEDNGPGIPKERQGNLFEAFTQADMSNTRQTGGVGLGLAICKSLVEAHGGQLGLGSNAGRGATFWFTLPLADLDGA